MGRSMMPAVDQHSVSQEIAMRFVFIRHGHYDKPKDKAARPRASLTPQGREAAQRAGEFLREQGIVPDLVCHTSTARARETADIVLRELGVERPVVDVGSGFQKGATRREIKDRVAAWAALAVAPPEVIAFVGHDTQQNRLPPRTRARHALDSEGEQGLRARLRPRGRWLDPRATPLGFVMLSSRSPCDPR